MRDARADAIRDIRTDSRIDVREECCEKQELRKRPKSRPDRRVFTDPTPEKPLQA